MNAIKFNSSKFKIAILGFDSDILFNVCLMNQQEFMNPHRYIKLFWKKTLEIITPRFLPNRQFTIELWPTSVVITDCSIKRSDEEWPYYFFDHIHTTDNYNKDNPLKKTQSTKNYASYSMHNCAS